MQAADDEEVPEGLRVSQGVQDRGEHVVRDEKEASGEDDVHVGEADPEVLPRGAEEGEKCGRAGDADRGEDDGNGNPERETLGGEGLRLLPVPFSEGRADQGRGAGAQTASHGDDEEKDGERQ